MELCYSKRLRPYITMDDGGTFIFSEETSSKTHYKYLMYSGLSMSTLSLGVSGGKGKPKVKKVLASESLKFFVPFDFKGMPRESKKVIDSDELERLIDTISPFLERGWFPKNKMDEFSFALREIDAEESDEQGLSGE